VIDERGRRGIGAGNMDIYTYAFGYRGEEGDYRSGGVLSKHVIVDLLYSIRNSISNAEPNARKSTASLS